MYAKLWQRQTESGTPAETTNLDSLFDEVVKSVAAGEDVPTYAVGSDPNSLGLGEAVEYDFPVYAETVPVGEVPDWSAAEGVEMSKSSAPREGFHVAFTDGRAVSVKASPNTLAVELFCTRAAGSLGVRCPALRVVLSSSAEYTDLTAAVTECDRRQGGMGGSRTRRFPMRKALLVSEYVAGGRMRSLRYCDPAEIRPLFKASADAALSPGGVERLRVLGRVCALNLWFNNLHGVPMGDVWSGFNTGNPKNVLFDNTTNELVYVDFVVNPILHTPLAEAYCDRVATALSEVASVHSGMSRDTLPRSITTVLDFLVAHNMYDVGVEGAVALRDGVLDAATAIAHVSASELEDWRRAALSRVDGIPFIGADRVNLDFLLLTQATLARFARE